MKSVKAILSDWGNVAILFDNERTVGRLARHSTLDAKELRVRLFGSSHSPTIPYEQGKISTWEFRELARRMCELDERLSDVEFDDAYVKIFQPDWDVLTMWARARSRGLVLTAVSNVCELRHAAIRGLGIENFFDRLVLSYKERMAKPSTELMVRALDRSGAVAEEAVFVDDIAANLEPARELGIRTHHYRDLEGLKRFLITEGLQELVWTN